MKKTLLGLLMLCLMQLSILTHARTVYIHLDKNIPKDIKLRIGYFVCYTNNCSNITANEILDVTKKNGYETFPLDIANDQSIIMWGVWNATGRYDAWGHRAYDNPRNELNACNTFRNNSITFVINKESPLNMTCIAGTD